MVKHRGSLGITGTRYVYAEHPFDVVGWDGCLYPYTFNISDFEPLTGRVCFLGSVFGSRELGVRGRRFLGGGSDFQHVPPLGRFIGLVPGGVEVDEALEEIGAETPAE